MSRQKFFLLFALPAVFVSPALHAVDLSEQSLQPLPLPEVLTPVRLKQPRTEVPASVSVIDHDMIVASGIRELPELLRLVPGMAVGAASGWDYRVSYHGTSRYNAHRMQVLIDGRSVYQASLATINWDDIPLAMEDIERIEVTRGPDTAAYGANAFLGIINIITRHPDDSPRWRVKATYGNKSTEDYYASTSGKVGNSSYRVSTVARRDSGFDFKSDHVTDRRDSKNPKFIQGRWIVIPTSSWTLDFQAGYKTGKNTNDYRGKGLSRDATPQDEYVDNYFASVNSQHFLTATNSLKWQLDYTGTRDKLEWVACQPATNLSPLFAPTDQACGDLNRNITSSKLDLDVQDTWLSTGPYKLVSGFHVQHQYANSESYYSGSISRTTYQLFGNFEYRFSPKWITTLAGSEEYMDLNQRAFSPRVALLFLPTENQSFRAVYSEAVRSPDLFENRFKWHQIARNVTINGIPLPGGENIDLGTIYPPQHVTYEKIRSQEIGYYGLWFNRRLSFDLKLFNDSLSNLITDPPVYDTGYYPINDTKVDQHGAETEIDVRVGEHWQGHLAASIINSGARAYDPNYDYAYKEETLTPQKSGAVALIYHFDPSLEWSNFYYYQPIDGNTFSRWDMRVAKRMALMSSTITLAATLQHYFDHRPDLLADSLYNGPNKFYFTVDLSF